MSNNDHYISIDYIKKIKQTCHVLYDVTSFNRLADFIDMMMYDFHGEWEETVNVHSALYSKTDEFFIVNTICIFLNIHLTDERIWTRPFHVCQKLYRSDLDITSICVKLAMRLVLNIKN